jgi:hypothetical protein
VLYKDWLGSGVDGLAKAMIATNDNATAAILFIDFILDILLMLLPGSLHREPYQYHETECSLCNR